MNLLNNSVNSLLQNALSASTVRQSTIAGNIANADTPNYKAKKAVFSHELSNAVNTAKLEAYRTDPRHVQFRDGNENEKVRVVTRNNTQYNHNGNNVDMDTEMAELAKNQIYYNTLIDRLNGRYNSIRTVLGQGR
ncbi:flagellar basal body rod protein FlgB [Evansella sp. LMS18]|uniref:flagellar basal body rod protein FlgB n=1 Tax=Evansella sp. LMS18 TaxID=2924033 RepID=UPI0020D164EC|nr:flagellar basal body rod protein FlgB [Evansella sp. LMS18]UTR10872.1 flagellar basal body rod protein FlgB [Evansella sp. LMS18]